MYEARMYEARRVAQEAEAEAEKMLPVALAKIKEKIEKYGLQNREFNIADDSGNAHLILLLKTGLQKEGFRVVEHGWGVIYIYVSTNVIYFTDGKYQFPPCIDLKN